MELTLEEIDLILGMQVYEIEYKRNPKPYDSLREKVRIERERLLKTYCNCSVDNFTMHREGIYLCGICKKPRQ